MLAAGIYDSGFLLPLADVNFQVGTDWYKDFDKTWSYILKGDYEAAAREVQNSKWYKQSPRRRSFSKSAAGSTKTPETITARYGVTQ